MASAILLPRQGQSVERCIIGAWKKQVGDSVAVGDILAEVETDKAMLEVESTAAGVLLAQFFQPGDEVAVLTTIAAVGQAGEDARALDPRVSSPAEIVPAELPAEVPARPLTANVPPHDSTSTAAIGVSPRARALAAETGIDANALHGSGPRGRVIARDVAAYVAATAAATTQEIPSVMHVLSLPVPDARPRLTPLAAAMVNSGDYVAPPAGTGRNGKVMTRDLQPQSQAENTPTTHETASDDVTVSPVRGVRKVIAGRMLASMQTTAQLTMSASADARALQGYRQRLKDSAEALGLRRVTINDLILFAVARTLPAFPDLNAIFEQNVGGEGTICQYRRVHLGFAVDTPRGLVVPVIRDAHRLGLKALADEGAQLVVAALENKLAPDAMNGGTFTVTNLGNFGIEHFTPILNPPQVAILGVGSIQLKPMQGDEGAVAFIPHIGLSLTINHQVVDGAPAARFLHALAGNIAGFELLLAL